MEFKKLSSDHKQFFPSEFTTVGEIKRPISMLCGVPRHCIEIVDKEEGIIYDDSRSVRGLSLPLEVMVGRNERRVPAYLVTMDPDMILQDPDDEEPRLKMSCGHAITPDNLMGHVKVSLIDNVMCKIICLTRGCGQEWEMGEIIRKADMTEDERIFYESKISSNALFQNNETSECPECGQLCQRQQSKKPVRCTVCLRRKNPTYEFCWDCKSPWVHNHDCGKQDLENIQKILDEAPRKTLDYSNIQGVPSKRLCPGCKIIIEHESMCKQMTCRNCKFEFCFSCLTPCVNSKLQCSNYSMACNVAPIQNVFS